MRTGRVVSIKKSWVNGIDIGSVRDDQTGELYTFNAEKDRFRRDEKVKFGPIEGTKINKGDIVLLEKA